VQVHDADQLIALVDDRHRHDTVLLHSIEDRARQLTAPGQLGASGHDAADRNTPEIIAALDEPAEISRCQYPIDVGSCVDDNRDSTPLRNHDDRLPHGVSIPQDGELVAKHDLVDLGDHAEGAAGVESDEIFALEAPFLEERDRQGVAQGEGRRGAGRGGEIVWAGLLRNAGVEDDIALLGER
jgi:hypothetical protein